MKSVLSKLTVLAAWLALSVAAQSPDALPPGAGPGGSQSFRGQPGGRARRNGFGPGSLLAAQMLSQGDKDHDKALSKDELTGLADAWFALLDPDGAGSLTAEQFTSELAQLLPAGSRARPSGADSAGFRAAPQRDLRAPSPATFLGSGLFAAFDANKDGSLTRTEFTETFAKWFNQWDTRKTGKLSEEDLRQGLDSVLPRPNFGPGGSGRAFRADRSPPTDSRREARNRDEHPHPADEPSAERSQDLGGSGSPAGQGGGGFDAFKIIAERNIFDTSRRGPRPANAREERPKRMDTLSLVGTLFYAKGPYAFFDGSSPDYRKVLEPGKTILGYKILEITGNSIKLESGTNTLEMRVGMRFRREDEGEWQLAGSAEPRATRVGGSSASSRESAAGEESDVVKRLMQQREQELK
jgi:Ca2+-binding EF-hand superfamily protein